MQYMHDCSLLQESQAAAALAHQLAHMQGQLDQSTAQLKVCLVLNIALEIIAKLSEA
jgi:hypothetical protein